MSRQSLHRLSFALLVLILSQPGCKKEEAPPSVQVGQQTEKTTIAEKGNQEKKAKDPPLAKTQLVTLDLTPHGLFGVIDVPGGTTVDRDGPRWLIKAGKETWLSVVESKEPFQAGLDQLKQAQKITRLLINEPEAALAEAEAANGKVYVGLTQAKLGEITYRVEIGQPLAIKDVAEARKRLDSARTLRQTPAIQEAFQKQGKALAALTQAGCLVEQLPEGSYRVTIPGPLRSENALAGLKEIPRLSSIRVQPESQPTLAMMEHIAAAQGLVELHLHNARVNDALLAPLATRTGLQTLILDTPLVTDAGLLHCKPLVQLRRLVLGGTAKLTQVTGTCFAAFGNWSKLTELEAREVGFTEEGMKALGTLSSLQKLDLADTRFSDRGMVTLRNLPLLESLSLAGTRITDTGLAQLGNCTALKFIDLSRTRITGRGLRQLRDAATGLEILNLANTLLNDDGAQQLKNFRVRRLDARGSDLTDVGLPVIGSIQPLEYLNLSGSGISDNGLQELSKLAKLTELVLDNTSLTGEGFKGLETCTSLKELSLINTLLNDAGLAQLPVLPALKTVRLNTSAISDKGLRELARLPGLEQVDLLNTAVTADGIVAFQKMVPKAVVNAKPTPRKVDDKPSVPPIPIAELKAADPVGVCTRLGRKAKHLDDQLSNPIIEIDWSKTAATDRDLAELRELKNLRSLNLTGTKISDAGLAYLTGLTALEVLQLRDTEVKGSGLVHLQGLKALRILALPDAVIPEVQANHLVALKNLERLDIHIEGGALPLIRLVSHFPAYRSLQLLNAVNPVMPLLGKLTNLEELTLGGEVNAGAMKAMKELKSLKSLKLDIPSLGDAGYQPIGTLTSLEELRITGRISDAGVVHLSTLTNLLKLELPGRLLTDIGVAQLRDLDKLAELILPNAQLTDRSLQSLGSSKSLDTLIVPGGGFTDAGVSFLKEVEELRKLDLSGSAVTGKTFSQLKEGTRLQQLVLRNTKVNDAGLASIAELRRLIKLDLANTAITDAGISALKKLRDLTTLSLAGNSKITDAALNVLKELPKLEEVHLGATGISRAAITQLQKERPGWKIVAE